MLRFFVVGGLAVFSLGVATAGQIQIGGADGLTSSYVALGCSGTGSCIAGAAAGTFSEQGYQGVLFSGATNGASTAVPFTGYTPTGATPSGSTLADTTNNVTFSMISDGAGVNFWSATGSPGASSANYLTIPVGVYGVASVWTVLSEQVGSLTGRDANIVFSFGATPNATTGLTIVTVKLSNASGSSTAAPAGQLRAAVNCTTGTCPGANGPTLASTVGAGTGAIPAGVTVLTNNLYSFGYTAATGVYSGTSGNVVLDDQGFIFSGSLLNTAVSSYLVSVKIQDANTGSSTGIGLSAITVDAVPEPGTILTLLSGLGAVGLAGLRRRR
jgi:hypothetical protein